MSAAMFKCLLDENTQKSKHAHLAEVFVRSSCVRRVRLCFRFVRFHSTASRMQRIDLEVFKTICSISNTIVM